MNKSKNSTFISAFVFLLCTCANAQSLQSEYNKKIESQKKARELDEIVSKIDASATIYQCEDLDIAFSNEHVFLKKDGRWTKEIEATYVLAKDNVNWYFRRPVGAYYTSVYFELYANESKLFSKTMIVNEYGKDITPEFNVLWGLMGKQTPSMLDEHPKQKTCVLLSQGTQGLSFVSKTQDVEFDGATVVKK